MKNEKKGLGTGLGALFGDSEILNSEDIPVTLPISEIEPRADQPRKIFREESLQDLADSIAKFGLIQPITVRRLESGYYQIIAGERRWRASRLAGLEEVPVRILEADDITTAQMALIENLQREDLNPIEEEEGYKSLIEDYSFTQDEAAKCIGKSRPAVSNSLRLLSLSEKVKVLVADGKLSAGHARALVPIEDAEAQLKAANTIIEKGLSVRQTEKLASELLSEKKEKEVQDKTVIDYAAEISKSLSELLGRKVKLSEGKKNGKIELEYYGADDREVLIEALKKIK